MLANKSASQTKEEHNAIQVECKKLSLSIKITKGNLWNKTKKTKGILYDISATFKPGRLTAIMGASGSGKTSLLSILVFKAWE